MKLDFRGLTITGKKLFNFLYRPRLLAGTVLCKNFKPEYDTGTVLLDISDHFMNFITIPQPAKTKAAPAPKEARFFSLNNMTNFKNAIGQLSWNDVLSIQNVDESFDAFWTSFSTMYDLNFPLIKFKFNRNLHSKRDYMTPGLLISRKRKLELHKMAIIDPPTFSTQYKHYRNIFNSLLRASKKLHYDSKFTQFAKNPKKVWEILNEITGSKSNVKTKDIPTINAKGTTYNSPPDIANEFNSFFVKAGQNISEKVPPTTRTPEWFLNPPPTPVPDFDIGSTSALHVSDIIKSFPNKSSLDIDGLSLKLSKFVRNEISTPLAHIIDLSFTTGVFPTKLKINRTVPIFKSGDTSLCNNYRPIFLIPTLSKIIEKMVATSLTNHLQLNNLLHPNQFGFLRNLSTEHNLLKVFNYIGEALNGGKYCIGIFLDLRKAFDTCSHEILLKKLSNLGVRDMALDWFRSYLSNRMQKVDVNGHLSELLSISCGVFQGSILGPILFLCYINDIFSASDLATFLFADDTTCLAENNNLSDLIDYVNSELNKLAVWFKANRMAVNVSKTNYIIFHTRGKKTDLNGKSVVFNSNDPNSTHVDPNLIQILERVHDNHIDPKMQSFKLLGVFLDEHLTLNKHVNHTTAKLSRALYLLKRVKHFVSPGAMRKLYFSLFHSHLLYCINILSCTSQTNITRILIMQKKAIRTVTNAPYNAHTNPLFLELNVLPFDKLITLNRLLFMHAIAYNYAPKTFDNTWITNAERNIGHDLRNNDFFVMPQVRIELFRRFPLYALPHELNILGENIRLQHNRTTFKIALTDFLLSSLHDNQPT